MDNIMPILAVVAVIGVIIIALYFAFRKTSGFLFEVTPNKQRCSIGYLGLPHLNFNYVPDYDRMNMPYCDNVNAYNQAKLLKTPKDETVKDDMLILQNAFMY